MRFLWKRVPFTLAGFPLFFDNDKESNNMFLDAAKNETGWDRLRSAILSTECDEMSPQLSSIHQSIFLGGFIGMIYGGIRKSRIAFNNFIRINDATKYQNVLDAKRKLQDEVTISFIKGAYRYGWRVALFTGSYVGLTTLIGTYRGKSSIIEYTVAGTITGMMYKVPLGPRAMVSGGTIGGVLGTLAGAVTLLILKTTGTTVEELRYWQLHFKNARDKKLNDSLKEALRAKDWESLRIHDDIAKDIPVEKQLDKVLQERLEKEKSLEKKEDSKK